MVAGDGGAFGQVAARGGGWCSRSLRLSQGLWGWAKEHAWSRWRRPWRWGRAISLPWSQVRVLIAPSGSARMRRVRAPAPGRALPAPGEGPPGRGSAWCARPGSPIALAPLLADDQVALPVPRYRPVVDVRAPARSTACPRSGAHNPPAGALLRAQRREGSTIPCSYEVPPPGWRVDPCVDRLVADRAPIGCWGVGHGAHLAKRSGP